MIYTKSQSYQGILQIRPNDKNVLDYVYDEIKKNGNVFITKEIVKKFGVDLYLTNKFFLIQLGKKLKQKFPGTVARSRSLYGVNRLNSKLVYRTRVTGYPSEVQKKYARRYMAEMERIRKK